MLKGCILAALMIWGLGRVYCGNADEGAGSVIVDRNVPGTVTAGIQEALDSLPKEGGVVILPTGEYEIAARIYMKPDTWLRGYGPGSIIRKNPGLRVLLAEDVTSSSTQNYIVVEHSDGLRPGMDMSLGEMGGKAEVHVYIDRVEGNKIYLNQSGHRMGERPLTPRPWKPTCDLKVENQAAMYNGFMLIRTSLRNVISDLALDGNREAQKVDGEKLYRKYPYWWIRLRCVPYMGGDSRIENCRVYGAAQVAISLGSRATVFNCDVSHSFQGIHPGSGPYSRVIQNTVHHNDTEGIYMCWGNYGVIISQNHIYANGGSGIGQLGRPCSEQYPEVRHGRSGDRFIMITDNVIYHNGRSAIQDSAIGKAEDYIITGNLLFNNWQSRLGLRPGRISIYNKNIQPVPAAISFRDARQCVIANNRIFDDQDLYPAELKESVPSGATELKLEDWVELLPMFLEPMDEKHYYATNYFKQGLTNFTMRIAGGGVSELHRVERKQVGTDWVLITEQPLLHGYAKGARITIEKTQLWGIYLGGSETEQNIVANNLCVGNAVGGINWMGRDMAVQGNLGRVVEMDARTPRSVNEVIFPFATTLTLPGLDAVAETAGWSPNAVFAASDRTDGRMLVLANATGDAQAEAVYNPGGDPAVFPVKPNTFYRITAWVKTKAEKDNAPVLPRVMFDVIRENGDRCGTEYNEWPLQDMRNGDRAAVAPGAWLRGAGNLRTPGDARVGQIICRLDRGAQGTAWVGGIAVEEIILDGAASAASSGAAGEL